MKFKNGSKRFLTLNPNNSEGFTLVELIVVIAIIAILAGVAVPAYNGYIEKANKQADISLISEIENALTLAYYNQDLLEGSAGFIMLSPNEGESFTDEDDEGNSLTAIAMEKVFGSSWLDTMQLKYDSWGVSWDTISYEEAQAVVGSNFVQKYSANELMAQVQAMTDAVNGLSFNIGDTQIELYGMFDYEDDEGKDQNAIEDVMAKYGITKSWDDLSSSEKSNLLVLATASSISNGNQSGAANVIPKYALYTAYAAENAAFNEAYKTFQTTISSVDPDSADSQYEQIKNAYKTLQQAATVNGFDTWNSSNGATNQAAFVAIMAGVGNAMEENGDAIIAELGNSNMFTTGIGNELYNDYLNAAYAIANNGEDFGDLLFAFLEIGEFPGAVFVQYTVVNGEIRITNSLPIN